MDLSGKFGTVTTLHIANTICKYCHSPLYLKLGYKGRLYQQNNERLNYFTFKY